MKAPRQLEAMSLDDLWALHDQLTEGACREGRDPRSSRSSGSSRNWVAGLVVRRTIFPNLAPIRRCGPNSETRTTHRKPGPAVEGIPTGLSTCLRAGARSTTAGSVSSP